MKVPADSTDSDVRALLKITLRDHSDMADPVDLSGTAVPVDHPGMADPVDLSGTAVPVGHPWNGCPCGPSSGTAVPVFLKRYSE